MAGIPFSHTCNPVPCNPPLGRAEVHEHGSSTTPPENLSLGYTKVSRVSLTLTTLRASLPPVIQMALSRTFSRRLGSG